MKNKIAMIIGSLRKESFNKKMAKNIIELFSNELELEIIEINNLPLYNQDFDENNPIEYVQFREKIKQFDNFLFLTPEHNRSIPSALKNAIDIASRPYNHNLWNKKHVAIISMTIGNLGAFAANQNLKQILSALNVFIMNQPEAYISNIDKIFDERGKIINNSTKEFIKFFINSFINYINKK